MKKYFLLLLVSVILFSCENDREDQLMPTKKIEKKYSVSFTTDSFSQVVTNFKSASNAYILDDSLNRYIPKLYIRIYDLANQGSRIFSETQFSGSTNFGKLTTQLPAGNYVAIFVGSGHQFSRVYGFNGVMEPSLFKDSNFDTRVSVIAQNAPLNDIFYNKVYFSVSNQSVNQSVNMNRMVAGLNVVIEDPLPATVTTLSVTVKSDAALFYFQNENRSGFVDKISEFLPTNQLNAFVLGTGAKNIVIQAMDNTGKIIAVKTVNANFYTNKKTTISGKLFTPAALSMSVNSTWDSPPPPIPF